MEVADRGPGLLKEFLPHAFERFQRAEAARRRDDGGRGLGLAMVQAIARAHGGEAMAFNRAGGGAVVSLRLPGAASPRAAAADQTALAAPAPGRRHG